MIIRYISLEGNRSETEDIVHIPESLKLIDGVYFEQKLEKKAIKKDEIIIPEVVEEEEEINEELEEWISLEIEEEAKEFLKENKVKGYGLLKGANIVKKAKELGFNL
jgi:hypothetical protein